MIITTMEALDSLRFDAAGLIPVVAQDARTGAVLMLAWADREALERTLRDGSMWYRSRSRDVLWHKGDTSGNTQRLVSLHADCDADTILALVHPAGPACHTGKPTCFGAFPVLTRLGCVIRNRAASLQATTVPPGARTSPAASPPATADPVGYTRRLLGDANQRLKKLGEECVELVRACDAGDRSHIAGEAADLLYHLLVACAAEGVTEGDILAVLAERLRD
jgi:phosphoribosyl-AMP cyclohydrolase / phosphoribosyl-ATP pyrophosphohydrolase